MTMKQLTMVVSVCLFVGVLLAQPGQMVPFKGYCYGIPPSQETVSGTYYDQNHTPVVIDQLPALCDVVGNSTHIGNFSGTIFFLEWPPPPDAPLPLGVVLWAANGDEVWADLTHVSEDGGLATILGGTGRFAGASGSWTNHPYDKPVPPGSLFAHLFDGMISSVGSSKK